MPLVQAKPVLDSEMSVACAEHLRAYASLLLPGCADDEIQQDVYRDVVECTHTLQTYADQMDPVAFQKMAVASNGRQFLEKSASNHRLAYKVGFLVHTFLFANLIRSAALFNDCVRSCLKLALPPVLQKPFIELLDDAGAINPSKSAISRWRMLVDGAHWL